MVKSLKDWLPKSLFGRALLILVLPMVLAQSLSIYVFYENHWDALARRLAQTLASDIMTTVHLYEDGTMPPEALARLLARGQDIRATLLPSSTPSGAALDEPYARQLARELRARGGDGFHIAAPLTRKDDAFMVDYRLRSGQVLRFDVPLKRAFSYTPYVFMLWMLGLSGLFLGIAGVFLRNQIRPIQRLAAAATAFGKGRPLRAYRPAGALEVRQAGEAFLAMQDSIQRHIQQRTAMLAGVSHDLRTPLTRMALQLALLRASLPEEDWQSLHSDVKDMEALINSYLAFAQGEGDETPQPVRLGDVLAEAARSVADNRVTLMSCSMEVMIHLKRKSIQRALQNIIQNAVKYGDQAFVYAEVTDAVLTVRVADAGAGIPPEEYEAVFRPFYRRESSRNSETGGVGLGLSIARDLARAHGGDVTLGRSAEHGGLEVTLRVAV